MLIFNNIQNTPKWSLGMVTSEKELYSQVKSLLELIIIVMIIALIVLYIIVFLISGIIAKPLI
ncbi:hypothetical protein I6U48_13820 [Clostridium sp. PL3]|uniref:Uncharacterized protein n=1 Tax=Clostridium thailandense TaxID=2794346 RepID=A0A949WRG0_9CLOT|nr:hypothetical protein [Clostridium thailandense]MBV7273980.1 hypothetical protein [Clostridium thailandense]